MANEEKGKGAVSFGIEGFDAVEVTKPTYDKTIGPAIDAMEKIDKNKNKPLEIDGLFDVQDEANAIKNAWADLSEDPSVEIPSIHVKTASRFKLRRQSGEKLSPEATAYLKHYSEILAQRKYNRNKANDQRIVNNILPSVLANSDPNALASRSMVTTRGAIEESRSEEKSGLAIVAETYQATAKANDKRASDLDKLAHVAFSQMNTTNKILQDSLSDRDKSIRKLTETITELVEDKRKSDKRFDKERERRIEAEDRLREAEQGLRAALDGNPEDLMKKGAEVFEVLKSGLQMMKGIRGE